MKIKEIYEGTTYYLNAASHYEDIADAKGKTDAVMFEMCQFEGDRESNYAVDALITSSTEDARAFAKSILSLCDAIEVNRSDK